MKGSAIAHTVQRNKVLHIYYSTQNSIINIGVDPFYSFLIEMISIFFGYEYLVLFH